MTTVNAYAAMEAGGSIRVYEYELPELMADEVEIFVSRGNGWVARELIVNSLGLKRDVNPLHHKNQDEKGFLCQVIMRLLEDQGRVEYKKDGKSTYYKTIRPELPRTVI